MLRIRLGAIAQLGERVLCKHEVVGSIPSGSTRRLIAAPSTQQPYWLVHNSFAVSSGICGLSNIVKRKHIWMLT